MEDPRARVLRHESEHGCWELVLGRPDPRLRGIVHSYEGYLESRSARPVLRQEVPSIHVSLIVNFGARWRIADSAHASGTPELRDSFVAGSYESSTFVAAEGAARCIQVDFTPSRRCGGRASAPRHRLRLTGLHCPGS